MIMPILMSILTVFTQGPIGSRRADAEVWYHTGTSVGTARMTECYIGQKRTQMKDINSWDDVL